MKPSLSCDTGNMIYVQASQYRQYYVFNKNTLQNDVIKIVQSLIYWISYHAWFF